jgi:hypothetical protein
MNTTPSPTLARKDVAHAIAQLRGFIGTAQLQAIAQVCCSEEKQFMFEKLAEMARVVATMPRTYETDRQGDQAIVHLHYFMGGCDWYITERDCETGQLQAFGKANLGHGSELGYISIVEVLACGAELDLYWTPQPLGRCPA